MVYTATSASVMMPYLSVIYTTRISLLAASFPTNSNHTSFIIHALAFLTDSLIENLRYFQGTQKCAYIKV